MRRNLRFIIERLYLGMLSLYPDRFRAKFGEELQDIFLRIVDEAEEAGNSKLLTIYFHELKSLTVSIVRERWHELSVREEDWLQIVMVYSRTEGLHWPLSRSLTGPGSCAGHCLQRQLFPQGGY